MQSLSTMIRTLFVAMVILSISSAVEARVLRKYSMNVAPPAPAGAADANKGAEKISEEAANLEPRLNLLKMQQRSQPEMDQDDIILPMVSVRGW